MTKPNPLVERYAGLRTQSEVAAILNIDRNTVRMIERRAFGKIRNSLRQLFQVENMNGELAAELLTTSNSTPPTMRGYKSRTEK